MTLYRWFRKSAAISQTSAKGALLFLLVVTTAAARAEAVNSGACDARGVADVMIVFDRSGSMGNGIEQLGTPPAGVPTRLRGTQIGTGSLLSTLAAADRAGLVSYSTTVSFDSGLTFDKVALANKVFALVRDDDTFAAPAIRAATRELLSNGRPGVRKIILHLSDGFSFGDPIVAAAEAKAAGIEFFAMAIGNDPRPRQAQGRDILAAQASDAAHYIYAPTEPGLYEAFDLFGEVIRTRQLTAKASSSTVTGTGLLAVLNLPLLVNPVAYAYDESVVPPLASPGGVSQRVTVPVQTGLINVNLGAIRNAATGTQTPGVGTATGSSLLTGVNVGLIGRAAVAAQVIGTEASVSYNAGAYTSSAKLTTADARVLGIPVAANVAPNTAIAVPGVLSVVLNAQPPAVVTADSIKRSVAFAVISSPLLGSLTLSKSTAELGCR